MHDRFEVQSGVGVSLPRPVLKGQYFSRVGSKQPPADFAGEQEKEELSGFFRLKLEMLQVGAKS